MNALALICGWAIVAVLLCQITANAQQSESIDAMSEKQQLLQAAQSYQSIAINKAIYVEGELEQRFPQTAVDVISTEAPKSQRSYDATFQYLFDTKRAVCRETIKVGKDGGWVPRLFAFDGVNSISMFSTHKPIRSEKPPRGTCMDPNVIGGIQLAFSRYLAYDKEFVHADKPSTVFQSITEATSIFKRSHRDIIWYEVTNHSGSGWRKLHLYLEPVLHCTLLTAETKSRISADDRFRTTRVEMKVDYGMIDGQYVPKLFERSVVYIDKTIEGTEQILPISVHLGF